MVESEPTENESTVPRRRVLQGLGIAASTSLAGCSSQGDGDGDPNGDGSGSDGGDGGGGGQSTEELGERVPALTVSYWASTGAYTRVFEAALPTAKNNWEQGLGLKLEINPMGISQAISELHNDARNAHIGMFGHTADPERLDPHQQLRRFAIDYAGANGAPNSMNYASCEYSLPTIAQESATSVEERRELVKEAHMAMARDMVPIPIGARANWGAGRTDTWDLQSYGRIGVNRYSTYFFLDSRPKGHDRRMQVFTSPDMLETSNFWTHTAISTPWHVLMNSTLMAYDPEAELVPYLAESYNVENDATRMTFELRDVEHHTGDPVTADDVKFTFEFLQNNAGSFPQVTELPIESIEVVDDKTVTFNFTKTYLPFLTLDTISTGIMHKETWLDNGVESNPTTDIDPVIGSGPFQVDDFQRGQYLALSPNPGHPLAPSADEHPGIVFKAYQDEQSAYQAFKEGELDVISYISDKIIRQVEEEMGDNAVTTAGLAGYAYSFYQQHPRPPIKFDEFRLAMGKALNRREITAKAFAGDVDPIYGSRVFTKEHPWGLDEDEMPVKFTDEPEGDLDGARTVLEDAGWGWDDNQRLHYPQGADLSPLWPKDGEPSADDFPCLDEI